MLETPKKIRELQRKLYQKAKLILRKPLEEDDWKAVCGKTAGVPTKWVGFDEGELEIGHGRTNEALPDESGRNR